MRRFDHGDAGPESPARSRVVKASSGAEGSELLNPLDLNTPTETLAEVVAGQRSTAGVAPS